ncbi:alpha/beta fold hydrolase [Geodermatophilus sabuli]|uniref:N-formylmaleamate deformylase n=1 Tax=Geodermatophilus sabuli TaxID=1564158 RepID=A0A285EN41_9ACTN|nr:alpha/beta hydrolase [Geodermatophilus sabuli]MBB3087052.1 N-formylmaleamate deformylase [Geodermatophilus sabuli]SNX99401.1 N-formylmaleamate deformylase [Geodermatophilus sabuli]
MTTVEIRGESAYVEANGLRHHVLRYGEPGARDLLVLPGITSPAATADFLAVLLADWGFRVTVPDVRGRGESDRAPAGRHRLADYAADVAGLVEALELRTPVVVGHSMGARIAAAWAVLHAPADHGLLVLVDPPTSGPGRGPYPTSREAFLEQLHEARRGTDAAAVRRFYPAWPERELQLRAEVLASCDETAVLETHEGFETEDFFEYWAQLTAPVVLIRGGDSPVVPLTAVADLRRARPDIEIVTVPGAGHMVPWDALPGFLDAVRPYLAAHAAPLSPA